MKDNYLKQVDSIKFTHAVRFLYDLKISPKSSGFVYLLQFIMLTDTDMMTADTYKQTVQRIAKLNDVSTRIIEDNMTLTLNRAWERMDAELLHEIFTADGKPTPKRRPWLRQIAMMLVMYCDAREQKDDIYAEFFGYCFRNGIDIEFDW